MEFGDVGDPVGPRHIVGSCRSQPVIPDLVDLSLAVHPDQDVIHFRDEGRFSFAHTDRDGLEGEGLLEQAQAYTCRCGPGDDLVGGHAVGYESPDLVLLEGQVRGPGILDKSRGRRC